MATSILSRDAQAFLVIEAAAALNVPAASRAKWVVRRTVPHAWRQPIIDQLGSAARVVDRKVFDDFPRGINAITPAERRARCE